MRRILNAWRSIDRSSLHAGSPRSPPSTGSGDQYAIKITKYAPDQLRFLKSLTGEPEEETQRFKRVRQSKRHPLWRLSHPHDPEVALRIICWFDPESDAVVVALFANDKAPMGDVFYDSVGTRADQVIDEWKRQNGRG